MSVQIEKTISNLIKNDFPQFYTDEGSLFIDFIMAYYEWMEQENNTTYHLRRFLDYRDIDTTIDQFMSHFSSKYLYGIPLNNVTDSRLLVKHALDIYRSKGSERSIKLLFSLLFGQNIDIYYPKKDIFILSSANWSQDTYLEVSPSTFNVLYLNQIITGTISGATAFVDRFVRKKINTKFVDVFYISAISGNFKSGEQLSCQNINSNNFTYVNASLNSVQVIDGGIDFNIGDQVNFNTQNMQSGIGLVSNTTNLSGLVSFSIFDSGWGYTPNSEILISENVLTLNNILISNTSNTIFNLFEQITQPLINLTFNGSLSTFNYNDNIFSYYSNGSINSSGYVISVSQNGSNGTLLISNTFGSFSNTTKIYTSGNSNYSNVSFISNVTATANIIGAYSNVSIYTNSNTNNLIVGETINQYNSSNNIIFSANIISTSPTALIVSYNYGSMNISSNLISAVSNVSINPTNLIYYVGVNNINNNFYIGNNSLIYSNNISSAYLQKISKGSGASFKIGTPLNNIENYSFIMDTLNSKSGVLLNANAYGFVASPSANVSSYLKTTFNFQTYSYGSISYLSSLSTGINYDSAPTVFVYEPSIQTLYVNDLILSPLSYTSPFIVGELVIQTTTNAKGIVKKIDSSGNVYIRRITVENSFNLSNTIIGQSSGAQYQINNITNDINDYPAGENAVISDFTETGNGIATEISVVDSGYSFSNGQVITFTSLDGLRSGLAFAIVENQGKNLGKYLSEDGFLSSNKKLYDALYYQDYSYDIRSSLSFSVYSNIIKKIVHTAGMIFYGTYVINNTINSINANSSANIVANYYEFTAPTLDFSNSYNSYYLNII